MSFLVPPSHHTTPSHDRGRQAVLRLVVGIGLFVLAFLIAYVGLTLLGVGR